MTTQLDNKSIVRRFAEEVFNNGNLAVTAETYAHQDKSEGQYQFLTAVRTAFPDLHCTIEAVVAEGDMVAVRATMTATHVGEWQGMAATGRKISWSLMVFDRLENGKVVEEWENVDRLGIMQQLGAIPQ